MYIFSNLNNTKRCVWKTYLCLALFVEYHIVQMSANLSEWRSASEISHFQCRICASGGISLIILVWRTAVACSLITYTYDLRKPNKKKPNKVKSHDFNVQFCITFDRDKHSLLSLMQNIHDISAILSYQSKKKYWVWPAYTSYGWQ